jgi:hypothetical protein
LGIKAKFTLQQFEKGLMYWFEDPHSAKNIWVLYEPASDLMSGSRWQRCVDDRPKGGPEPSCTDARDNDPDNPVRGFGWLWCEDQGVRKLVDQPRGLEFGSGDDPPFALGQFFQGGVMFFRPRREEDPLNTTDQVLVLFADGKWRRFDLPQ